MHLNTLTINKHVLSPSHNPGIQLLFSHGHPVAYHDTTSTWVDSELFRRVPSSRRHVKEWLEALDVREEQVVHISPTTFIARALRSFQEKEE